MIQKKSMMSRRAFFQKYAAASAGVAAGSLVTNADYEAIAQNVNTNSQPSNLKITDMRCARIGRTGTIRLDTNQGISGYGEWYAVGSPKTYFLMLKSRLLGMNPCNVDKIFRKIKQFGFHARQGGGVSGIEIACMDIAGKAWGVPVWQMLGGKFRDKVLVYADTVSSLDPVEKGKHLRSRMESEEGYKFLKMDLNIMALASRVKGGITRPPVESIDRNFTAHPFTGIHITEKGLKAVQEYCATIRDIAGWEIPIATDHYGHFPVEDCIKIAQALDQFNFAWFEDMVPWQYTDQYVRLKNSCTTPILTGEDIFCKEGFMDLFEKKAISICHPDLGWCGGILEAKKISNLATEHGIATAFHQSGSPALFFATVHCASSLENFMAMEHHNADDEWYNDLVDGVPKPFVKDGYVQVPDGPGLGFEFNDEANKKQLREPGWFEPTPEWDNERSWDRLWSFSKPLKNKSEQV